MILKMTSVSALALALAMTTPAMAQSERSPFDQARQAVERAQQQQQPERDRPEGGRPDRGGPEGRGRPERVRPEAPRPDRGAEQPRPDNRAQAQARAIAERQQEQERQAQRQQQQQQAWQDRARDRDDRGRGRDRDRGERGNPVQQAVEQARREQERQRDQGRDQRDAWREIQRRQDEARRDADRQNQFQDQWRQAARERERDRWERQREALERRQERDRESWRYVQRYDGRDNVWLIRDRNYGYINGCPPGLVWRDDRCLTNGQARREDRAREDWWWSSRNDDYRWRYHDGYAYREERRDNGLASVFIPLLAGALGLNNVWPQQYSYEPAPTYYRTYYDLNDRYDYRYADGVIYGVDRGGNRIERISALLVGDPWTVGQRMPAGYDVYNVPYDYRGRYRDRDDRWYRYSDGYVYQVDPTTRLVQTVIQLAT